MKKLNNGDIVMISTIAGDIIIGKYLAKFDDDYIIKKPLLVFFSEKAGGTQVGFAPYLPFFETDETPFQKYGVKNIGHVNAEFKSYYIKNTTGLDIPVTNNVGGIITG